MKDFMKQFQGCPCEICGTTHGTIGHHILGRRVAPKLKERTENIIVLCNVHHNTSNEIAAHSTNPKAQQAFKQHLIDTRGDDVFDRLRALQRELSNG